MAREEIRLQPRSKVIVRHAQQDFDTISSEVFLFSSFFACQEKSLLSGYQFLNTTFPLCLYSRGQSEYPPRASMRTSWPISWDSHCTLLPTVNLLINSGTCEAIQACFWEKNKKPQRSICTVQLSSTTLSSSRLRPCFSGYIYTRATFSSRHQKNVYNFPGLPHGRLGPAWESNNWTNYWYDFSKIEG